MYVPYRSLCSLSLRLRPPRSRLPDERHQSPGLLAVGLPLGSKFLLQHCLFLLDSSDKGEGRGGASEENRCGQGVLAEDGK
jgi:hypothetical protein